MGAFRFPGQRDVDGRRRPPRAAYVLPSLFTSGNIFLGFLAIMRAFQGALAVAAGNTGPNGDFETAAKAIGAAFVLDGLDGRIARMTNTTSDFGRELDSLADVITFGVAPAVLAFAWGIQFAVHDHRIGYLIAFLFLTCGALRLARFNIQKNPVPKNPGRPDRKYFVGLPIPAGAALVAAIVFASGATPILWWPYAWAWMALLFLLSFLMVSTWRYPSFKEVNLLKPRSPVTLIPIAVAIYLTWNFGQPFLLALAAAYVATGIALRIAGVVRRITRGRGHGHGTPSPRPSEQQIG
ncbi:MAG TPA: CDP-diacylglycerol--serine O-phosphatidyltransferase [Bryobacteraceae bacterium]|jgi:CDP-diacylglycerol--serine O-phosphatidyltransferase|nr:CDP-diacylglycerol--serine O-phosphatidyltransferase [Bryobacteraceae bacterium]